MGLVGVSAWSEKEELEQFKWGLWTQFESARLGVSGRATMIGFELTEPVDAYVGIGFRLRTRTWPLRGTPPVDKCLVWHWLLPSVSTYGTTWILSVGLSLHKWTRDGLVWLSYGIDTTKWALSNCLSLCTLTVDWHVCGLSSCRGSEVQAVLLYWLPYCVLSI